MMYITLLVFVFLLIILVFCCDQDVSLLGVNCPLVIAHRGSCGMLPEHTVEANRLAVKQNADVIECDLAVTKDLKLICSHEAWLNASTDIRFHPEFADRLRTYYVPRKNESMTDYFTIDFTLKELQTLKRVQVMPFRDQSYNYRFPVASFDEYVAVAKDNHNTKTIYIYPEIKNPQFFNSFLESQGTSVEDLILHSLKEHNYDTKYSSCFIQSFNIDILKYVSSRTDIPLVLLHEEVDLTEAQLEEYSSFISGLGPHKKCIVKVNKTTNTIEEITDYVKKAHRYGYFVHPFVFRNEQEFLAFDYRGDPYCEYETFLSLGVDGIFTDFAWTLSNYIKMKIPWCQKKSPRKKHD